MKSIATAFSPSVRHEDLSLGRASREICKVCYQVNAIGFSVPDETWIAVVPPEFRNRILCLTCFARLADEKLIPWDRDIRFWPVSMATHLGIVH